MSDYTGSNIAGILQAVDAEMARRGWPVTSELGNDAQAANAAPPRMVWVLRDFEVEAAAGRVEDGHIIDYEVQVYDVTIVTADEAAAQTLRFTLRVALDHLFGPWAAVAVGKGKRAPDGVTSTRSAFVMPVQLRVPNYSEQWLPVVITGATVKGLTQTADPNSTPEANP